MSASERCFIVDLHTKTFLANGRQSIRIMGVILAVESAGNQDFPIVDNDLDSRDMFLLILDDGTATIDIWTPKSMIDSLLAKPGETVDCIARLRQNGSIKRWYSNTLIRITDPEAESLRWMELGNPPGPNECRKYGYPRIKMNTQEAFRLIFVQSEINGEGLSLEELALVMQQTESKTKEMIQELQATGRIYQNRDGNYVPL